MMGQNTGFRLAPQMLHAAPDRAVQGLAPRPQQAAIGDALNDGVLEAIFEIGQQPGLLNELDPLQGFDMTRHLGRSLGYRADQRQVEFAADHRRDLHGLLDRLAQARRCGPG